MKTKYLVLLSVFIVMVFTAGTKYMPVQPDRATTKVTNTYASAQVDTIIVTREYGISSLSFGISFLDSSNVLNIVARRMYNGYLVAGVTADTLLASPGDSSATSGRSLAKTVTINGSTTPLPDSWYFIVKYQTNSGNINQGTTTPTATYILNKIYNSK
jgi:hypothetical protein